MTDLTFSAPRSRLAALIGEARRRGRRRNLALASIGLLALLAGGGIWAGLTLSGGGAAAAHAPPGYQVVQAQGPVAHHVLETWSVAQPLSVDVATGKARPVRTTREIWYDSRGNAVKFLIGADGRPQSDFALACHPASAACLPGFSFQRYWPLDTSRYTRQPGLGTFHGRSVIWIAPKQAGGFAAYPGEGERIGLDSRTHAPVAERQLSNGKVAAEAQVLARKPDIAAGKFAFIVRTFAPPLQGTPFFHATGRDPLALRAQRALGQRPLWLGPRFDGHRLQAVAIGSTFDPPTGIQSNAVPFVNYDYGNVNITEFSASDLYGPGRGPLPGRMTLQGPSSSLGMQLRQSGVFVMAREAHPGTYVVDRAGALRIARALRPVPLP
jgi:hypothetical protein